VADVADDHDKAYKAGLGDQRVYLEHFHEKGKKNDVHSDRDRVYGVEPHEFLQVVAFGPEDKIFIYKEILRYVYCRADDEKEHIIDDMREKEIQGHEAKIAENRVPRTGGQEPDLFFVF
jgi:hypothetical protein